MLVGGCGGHGTFDGVWFVAASGPSTAIACATFKVDKGNIYEPSQDVVFVGYPVDSEGVIGPETQCPGGFRESLSPLALTDGGKLSFADSVVVREDANGQPVWSTTLPFPVQNATVTSTGHVFLNSKAMESPDDPLAHKRSNQLGHLLLSDGIVTWVRTFRP